MEAAIEHAIEGLNDDLPWEIREYGLDVADTWWHPSRC
jgi:hypothetical protein